MSTKRLEDLERLSQELKEKKNELYECSKKMVDAVIAGEISSELDIQELKTMLIDLGEEERIWRQCERLYMKKRMRQVTFPVLPQPKRQIRPAPSVGMCSRRRWAISMTLSF